MIYFKPLKAASENIQFTQHWRLNQENRKSSMHLS